MYTMPLYTQDLTVSFKLIRKPFPDTKYLYTTYVNSTCKELSAKLGIVAMYQDFMQVIDHFCLFQLNNGLTYYTIL